MKYLASTLICFAATLSAQSVTRVNFRVVPGNLIEITYTLVDSEPNGLYNVDIFASLDGGYSFPVQALSCTGDVGLVRGQGVKSALWKVLDDVPVLSSDALVIKVTGRTQTTIGGIFRSLVVGNRLTKRLNNGVTFYGGQGLTSTYSGAGMSRSISRKLLIPGIDGRAGLRIVTVPFIYRIEALYRQWELELDAAANEQLVLLAFSNPNYKGGDILFYQVGGAFTVSYTPLPVLGFILPSIGAGIAQWGHFVANGANAIISRTTSTSAIIELGVQLSLTRWLKASIGGRSYLLSPEYDFIETHFEIGLHLGSYQ